MNGDRRSVLVVRPSVSCVIVAYKRARELASAIALLEHDRVEIVVVNVEDDPAVSAVAAAHRVVSMPVNRGYAAAVNRGVRAATAEVVVALNDDARLPAESALHLAGLILGGQIDVALPAVLDREGKPERTIARLPTPGALALEWLVLPDRPIGRLGGWLRVEKWRAPARIERVEAAAAVAVAARRDLLLDVEMPEEYFLYWEETEWFWRLREHGLRVAIVPDVTIVHDGGRDDIRPEKSRLLARNAVRCVRRTQGVRAALLAYGVVVLWNLRLLLGDVVRAKPRSRLAARLAGLQAALGSWIEVP